MKNICLNWTISILTGLFALFFITAVGFIFHISINAFYSAFSLIIFMILLAFLTINNRNKNAIKSILAQYIVLFDLIILFGIICYFIPDISFDGNTYHQAIIILLKSGLNPIWDNVSTFANSKEYIFSTESIEYAETFLKFFEIIGANFYFIFNKIELTKITNYILMLSAFCYSFYTLKNYKFSNLKSIFFAFLLIYNPVCICQMLSNYVDGAFYYVFLVLLFSCINYAKNSDINKNLYIIGLSSIILSNLKLTGLFTTLLVLISFLLIYRSKKLLITSIIASLFILICGINPYITNIKQGRNIFYPIIQNSIFEANKEGMITSYPPNFEKKNRFEKLFFSIFAVSKNISPLIKSDDVPRIKIPFTISGDDQFIFEDMRLAGFGYFFSGILTLSLILSLFLRFQEKEDKKLFLVVLSILLLSIIGNHEAWWARFVPQMWIIPIFIIIYINFNCQNRKKIISFSYFLSTICIINSLLINAQYFTNIINSSIEFYSFLKNAPKIIYLPRNITEKNRKYETFPTKMQEYGIKIIFTD